MEWRDQRRWPSSASSFSRSLQIVFAWALPFSCSLAGGVALFPFAVPVFLFLLPPFCFPIMHLDQFLDRQWCVVLTVKHSTQTTKSKRNLHNVLKNSFCVCFGREMTMKMKWTKQKKNTKQINIRKSHWMWWIRIKMKLEVMMLMPAVVAMKRPDLREHHACDQDQWLCAPDLGNRQARDEMGKEQRTRQKQDK